MAMSSQELKAVIHQLNNGLINEAEFVTKVVEDNVDDIFKLVQFNKLDPAERDWNFTLDAFAVWK